MLLSPRSCGERLHPMQQHSEERCNPKGVGCCAVRCVTCAMSPHTISSGGKSRRFYYYRCAKHMKDS